ncbi:short stop, isoform J [Anopheles sinensis]|uniref:Short stop, isoform J n=1 Tax=Anopheles sinensis TaxID=74873 RepID=A0A084VGW7_ANOSI|nr:short stop, isoform J [Anopheles sinensis]
MTSSNGDLGMVRKTVSNVAPGAVNEANVVAGNDPEAFHIRRDPFTSPALLTSFRRTQTVPNPLSDRQPIPYGVCR